MTNFNKVFLIGRVIRDAELKYTTSNAPVCQFDLAVNQRKKQGSEWVDDTLFLNRVALWGERGEKIAERLTKGTLVLLEGRLAMNEWEKDGQKHRELRVVATNVQVLRKTGDAAASETSGAGEPGEKDGGAR